MTGNKNDASIRHWLKFVLMAADAGYFEGLESSRSWLQGGTIYGETSK
jgi:hypothetical protein